MMRVLVCSGHGGRGKTPDLRPSTVSSVRLQSPQGYDDYMGSTANLIPQGRHMIACSLQPVGSEVGGHLQLSHETVTLRGKLPSLH